VARELEERPDVVDKCLAELEREICNLEDHKKNAYHIAKNVNPDYIRGRAFVCNF
jgi:hypothetical protein